jgi:pimeloyl-ACP methyl ester carboxylesterase
MPSRRPLVAAAAVVILATAGCAEEATGPVVDRTTPTEAGPSPTEPGGFTPEPIDWDDCGAVDCATVEVPLDHADPDGPTTSVYVVRRPATGDREGALFVNPGGPGGSGAELAELLPFLLPDEITERFDIVGVDPRGVGGSDPLDCGGDPADLYAVDATVETAEDQQALLEVSRAYAADCAATHGEVLPHIGTGNVARDMDLVRAAMGDDQLSFLGFSYGTAIGQVYADLFPDRIRGMVLDGAVELGPSGLDLAYDQAAGFETGLERFVQYCDAAEGCAVAGESLDAVEEVLALAEEPGGIPAPEADRPLGPGEANLGLGYAMYTQALWNRLGEALAEARDGDGSELVDMADEYLALADLEVYFGINCLDFAWPTGDADAFFEAAEATGEAYPHFGEALVTDYLRCVEWPVAPAPLAPVTADGAPPILVISTTGDPATPYEGGVAVADRLASGVLVTNEGDGHTVVADGKQCIDDLVVAYLVDGVVPEDGVRCAAS